MHTRILLEKGRLLLYDGLPVFLFGSTAQMHAWIRRETEEKEARGEVVAAPGALKMGLWRGLLRGRTTAANTARLLYNTLLAPVAGATRLEYQEARLPLNTEKLIETLFRWGGGGGGGGASGGGEYP